MEELRQRGAKGLKGRVREEGARQRERDSERERTRNKKQRMENDKLDNEGRPNYVNLGKEIYQCKGY